MRVSPPRVALALTVVAVLAAGCGVNAQRSPSVVRDNAVPFGLLQRNAPTVLPPVQTANTETVTLCFIQNEGLVPVAQMLDAPVSIGDVVAALGQPPEGAVGVRTAIGVPSPVTTVRLTGGVVRVDLDPTFSAVGGTSQLLAIAQIVCTLTNRPGVGQVAFSLSGAAVVVGWAVGSFTADPVSRDDYASLLR
jgi:spore germination protein GerM